MGCCCSKKEVEKQNVSNNGRWDPPPAPPEEEMVKEVLSVETPKPKPKSFPPQPPLNKLDLDELKTNITEAPVPLPETKNNSDEKSRVCLPLDDRSEQPQPSDEACSLSEATSIATVTSISSSIGGTAMATRGREWDREETSSSLPKIPKRSSNTAGNGINNRRASQLQSYSGELGRGRKERSSPPVVVSGVGCRSGRASPLPPLRANNRSLSTDRNGIKRDMGERSGRRSVSPGAKRRELAGTNKLPVGKDGLPPVRRIQPVLPNKAVMGTEQSGEGRQDGKELLDNPSVSLECFIFL